MFREIFENIQKKKPLVHCITNYVTVNDCANMLLAIGASPVMADDVNEVEDITSIASALVINIGTLNSRTIDSMILAGKKANEIGIPVVLDPVGCGASKFRTNTTFKLLKEIHCSAIRGNISEILTVAKGSGTTKGVDADESQAVTEENLDQVIAFAKELSIKTNAIIAITGAIDVLCDDTESYVIRNGNALMSKITGTGCMLTTVIAAFLASNNENKLQAVCTAVSIMGISGELGYKRIINEDLGTSSYRTFIIDYMSKMNYELFREGEKIEIR